MEILTNVLLRQYSHSLSDVALSSVYFRCWDYFIGTMVRVPKAQGLFNSSINSIGEIWS